jgi:DNA mismatch repair protein MutS2
LPVANAYKNKVKGIVQDVSGSGETTFIEPEVLVEMNNKMVELRNDEREEIRRLLAELSSEIASVAEPVLLNNKMIGYLDFVQAKALYADETKSHVAKMVKEPTIDLQNARHPLIDPKKWWPTISGSTRKPPLSSFLARTPAARPSRSKPWVSAS